MSSKAEHLKRTYSLDTSSCIHALCRLMKRPSIPLQVRQQILCCSALWCRVGSIAQSGLCWVLHQQRMNDEGLQTLWEGYMWLLAHTKRSAALQARVYCLIHAVPILSSRGEWCPAPCKTLLTIHAILHNHYLHFCDVDNKITTANTKMSFSVLLWNDSLLQTSLNFKAKEKVNALKV